MRSAGAYPPHVPADRRRPLRSSAPPPLPPTTLPPPAIPPTTPWLPRSSYAADVWLVPPTVGPLSAPPSPPFPSPPCGRPVPHAALCRGLRGPITPNRLHWQ